MPPPEPKSFFDSQIWDAAPGLIWALLVFFGAWWLRAELKAMASAVVVRLKDGSPLKVGSVELGAAANIENLKPLVKEITDRVLALEVRSADRPAQEVADLHESIASGSLDTEEAGSEPTTVRGLAGTSSRSPSATRVARSYELTTLLEEQQQTGPYAGDPWAGFAANRSGPPESTGSRRLTATVDAVPDRPGLFTVDLALTSEDGSAINAPVGFLLHPTFPQPRRVVQPEGGRVRVRLIAWGAFTVGCIDDRNDHLEINLAKLPDAPPLFRGR